MDLIFKQVASLQIPISKEHSSEMKMQAVEKCTTEISSSRRAQQIPILNELTEPQSCISWVHLWGSKVLILLLFLTLALEASSHSYQPVRVEDLSCLCHDKAHLHSFLTVLPETD